MIALVDSSAETAFASDGAVIATRSELRNQMETGFAMVAEQEMTVDQRGLQVTVLSSGAAAVTGIGQISATDTTGTSMEGFQAFTLVWKKKDGRWRIVQTHFSTRVTSIE